MKFVESNNLKYDIIAFNGLPCVKLHNPPQYLDADDLAAWMVDTRDDDPDLYAELVQVYFQLRKHPCPTDGNAK